MKGEQSQEWKKDTLEKCQYLTRNACWLPIAAGRGKRKRTCGEQQCKRGVGEELHRIHREGGQSLCKGAKNHPGGKKRKKMGCIHIEVRKKTFPNFREMRASRLMEKNGINQRGIKRGYACGGGSLEKRKKPPEVS